MKGKIQKHLTYKYKSKQHFKHVIIIPDEAITELERVGGQDLKITTKDNKLIAQISETKNVTGT